VTVVSAAASPPAAVNGLQHSCEPLLLGRHDTTSEQSLPNNVNGPSSELVNVGKCECAARQSVQADAEVVVRFPHNGNHVPSLNEAREVLKFQTVSG
jgi:hypothetical protein